MIRAIRPSAMAQDDATMLAGWNVTPNVAYVLRVLPGSASCGVLLYDEGGSTLIATGAALVGTAQPCVLIPQTGQTIGMVDADLGWHLLVTTTGTEGRRTIRLGPAVDLPDEIHPVYGDDDLALARATAAIDAATHYPEDVTVTCQLGLGAGLGDVVSVPVDGVAVVGQVESIPWTATPDGTAETAVIRRLVAIAPEAFVEITPPTVADDAGTATHLTGASGNVLANDTGTMIVVAVNGLSANVGIAVDGDNGGVFTIAADGQWMFDPNGDFALLEGSETADTSITYHASNGASEAMASLTVTVSRANAAPAAVDDTGETDAATTTSGNVLTNDTDADLDTLTVSQVAGSAGNVGVVVAGSNGGLFTISASGAWTFDPDSDFDSLTGTQTATTSVTYHVSDGVAEVMATLTVSVSAASAPTDPLWPNVLVLVQAPGAGSSIADAKEHTVTIAGNLGVVTTLGSPSIYFDGNGDYARIPYTSDLAWGAVDWTLESIFYPTSVAAGTIFCDAPSFGGFYAVRILLSSGILAVYMYDSSNTEFLVGCGAISANVLHHVAVQRINGTTLNIYKDGAFAASRSIVSGRAMKAMSAPYTIGAYYSGDYYSGHILAVRKTYGQARYPAGFTPPTWPLPVS